jgi:hypothetical protein
VSNRDDSTCDERPASRRSEKQVNNPSKLFAANIVETIMATLAMPRRTLWPELAAISDPADRRGPRLSADVLGREVPGRARPPMPAPDGRHLSVLLLLLGRRLVANGDERLELWKRFSSMPLTFISSSVFCGGKLAQCLCG